jgi:hypothetical protein
MSIIILSFSVFLNTLPLDGYIQGKICDINGEPINRFEMYVKSSNGNFSTGKYHPPYSNNKGEYQIYISHSYLPAEFEITSAYETFDAPTPLDKNSFRRKVFVKKGETVYMDIMIDKNSQARPWWRFKYNTGNCDKPSGW